MLKSLRRAWRYLGTALGMKFEEAADPKVQLEQAIQEAQEQHRRLTEQAANVIANQKQTEMRLNRALEELEKVNASARQAVLMADDAAEKEVEGLKTLSLQTTQAADQAKAAVAQNSSALQRKLSERQKLMSQLDQAKMQEQMNKAMATLSETVGQDVPTLNEVRDKIERRYAKALGTSELQGQTVESRMLEVEQASMNAEAQARLAQIRDQLGIAAPAPAAPATEPAQQEGGGAPAS